MTKELTNVLKESEFISEWAISTKELPLKVEDESNYSKTKTDNQKYCQVCSEHYF